jgi:hypothetical protein
MKTLRRAVSLLAFAVLAFAQEGGSLPGGPPPGSPEAPPRGAAREQMWPAPTAEDWARPCLVTWQRTWEDAVAVAKETGRPILVCINMDGEIASEHYAGVRYRQPEIAALYEPYVCVIASVYRHTPRDHDEQGRRIPCPRFGTVTCGEHIAIEPTIFEKFCDGRRIAPRHICVELDGTESYDVFYANDTASVFETIRKGIAGRPPLPPKIVRSDRPLVERVNSREATDRIATETAYQNGDAETRKMLLDAALRHADKAPVDLLRLAIFGLDVEASRAARKALASMTTPDAARLVADALRVPMEDAERKALFAALRKMGESSDLARWLAAVHEGLAASSGALDLQGWSEAIEKGTFSAPALWLESGGVATRIEETAALAAGKPDDPAMRLDLAQASLALAVQAPATMRDGRAAQAFARRVAEDAHRLAKEAEALGAKGWRLEAVLALAAYHADDLPEAYARAEAAVRALPPGDTSWASMAVVTVFAESRWKAIKQAVRDQRPWPPEWLADVHNAYRLLREHPLGTDTQVAWHYDLLEWIGADHGMMRVLQAGLERFEDSEALHQRFRDRTLKVHGPEGLEAAYEEMLGKKERSPLFWTLAGTASVAAADHLRRARKLEPAFAAYGRAIARFEAAAEGDFGNRGPLDASIALAHAARARVAYELGDDDRALREILASLERGAGAAGTRDEMGITPGETAKVLLLRLRQRAQEDAARRLEEALAKVDPELLVPDEG